MTPKLELEEEKPGAISAAFALLLSALLGDQSELLLLNETTGQALLEGHNNLLPVNEETIPLLAEGQPEQSDVNAIFETIIPNMTKEENETKAAYLGDTDTVSSLQADDETDDRMPDILPGEDKSNVEVSLHRQEYIQELPPDKIELSEQADSNKDPLEKSINREQSEVTKPKISLAEEENETTGKGNLDFPSFLDDSNSSSILTTEVESKIQPQQETLEAPTIEVNSDDLVERLVSKVKMVQEQGETQLEIQLKPEYLGKLRLEFLYREGKVSTHLVTKNPQVRELLLSHLPELRETLNQQSVLQENMDIDVFVDQQGVGHETSGQEYNGNKQQPIKTLPPEVKGNNSRIYSDVELTVAGLNYLI